jgi:hypothetical protein
MEFAIQYTFMPEKLIWLNQIMTISKLIDKKHETISL